MKRSLHTGIGGALPVLVAAVLVLTMLSVGGCDRASNESGRIHEGHDHEDHGHEGHDHAEHDLADDDHAGDNHADHDHASDDGHAVKEHGDHDHAADGGEEHALEGERVAIPAPVRSNLGISFVAVERRRVEQTLRVPGRFEYLPTARREYRTAIPGRVDLLVEQFERVETGQPLYRLDSPAWRETQQGLVEARVEIERLEARLETYGPLIAAHEQHEASLRESAEVWEQRVEHLRLVREAGGGRIDELTQARSSLASTRADLAEVLEKKAQLDADRKQAHADLGAASSRLRSLLDAASAIVAVDADALRAPGEEGEPLWASIRMIEVGASEPGVVESLGVTNGSWADERTPVLTIVRPERLRFRASGLQSDLGVLRDGLATRIVPPTPTAVGRAVPLTETMAGTLALGLGGDPNDRTLDLFVVPDSLRAWARPGVSAQLEIVTDASAGAVLAVPLAAVQRDGLTPLIFRRDPGDPDQAIRVEADLGADDGRWVELLGGVREGDEVVLDGAFQLMLATSGSVQKGGHFHSDGTFHDGED